MTSPPFAFGKRVLEFVTEIREIGEDDFGVDRLREMREFVKQLDPTRCVTRALYPSRRDGGEERIQEEEAHE